MKLFLNATFMMFRDGDIFAGYLKISLVLYNAKYWIWNAKQYLLAMLNFGSILLMFYSSFCSCQTFVLCIYISITSSHMNSSSTIHFNICWLEIHVRTTSWYRYILRHNTIFCQWILIIYMRAVEYTDCISAAR